MGIYMQRTPPKPACLWRPKVNVRNHSKSVFHLIQWSRFSWSSPELDVMATFVTQTEDSLLQSEDVIISELPPPPGVNHRWAVTPHLVWITGGLPLPPGIHVDSENPSSSPQPLRYHLSPDLKETLDPVLKANSHNERASYYSKRFTPWHMKPIPLYDTCGMWPRTTFPPLLRNSWSSYSFILTSAWHFSKPGTQQLASQTVT